MKIILPLFACFILSLALNAQQEGLNSIDGNDLRKYMLFFASDELKGRDMGTPTNDAAAGYIRENLIKLGLKPFPGSNEYLQQIPLVSEKIARQNTFLEAFDKSGHSVLKTDSILILEGLTSSFDLTGGVVFIGYGYTDSVAGYDDLNGVDIKDKLVLMMTRNPEMVKSGTNIGFINEESELSKLDAIAEKGPKAILFVYDPENSVKDVYSTGIVDMLPNSSITIKDQHTESYPDVLHLYFTTNLTADLLLKNTGFNLSQMQEKIKLTGKPVSCDLPDLTATVRIQLDRREFTSSNVIGVIEGSDPVLKNECVVYSAHFDHVGVNGAGEVFNGADDNASGSMGLLEIAQAFMSLRQKPLRSIVFAWVNGEEKGLIGSQFYTDNPAFPMEKTIVNINFDMIGRSKMPADTGKFFGVDMNVTQPGEIHVYSAHESSELLKMMYSAAETVNIKITDMGANISAGSSDHASFMAKGVPALCFNSGIHSDLHTTRDDVEKIDFDKMEKVSEMAFLLGYKAANQVNRITIDSPLKNY